MTPEEWVRVRALFEEALQHAPPDVDGWLAGHAAESPDILAEVRSLLEHHARAGSFLDEPALDRLFAPDHALPPGTVLGAYTILRELGRGGMGCVYLSSDARLGRAVALKSLGAAFTGDPVYRDRFRREARAAAALNHPGICAIHALEELDGELFIVSEYLEGETLRAEIDRGYRPAPDVIARTARELASALAWAHARQIAHGDLKPENVMRTADGRVKILDFGLARMESSTNHRPETAAAGVMPLPGTPAYMAPEQLNGGPVDLRADLFALGVLLYEYASGVHPFQAGTELALLGRILEAVPTPLSERAPDVPPIVAEVVARCLSKAPADRYASAGDLVAALERSAAPGAGATVSRVWWRVHQAVIVALYVVIAVLAWHIKEWHRTPGPVWLFVALAAATAAGGVLRGHLLFTERVHPTRADRERRRVAPITLAVDALTAILLLTDAVVLAADRPLVAALTSGLAVAIAVAAALIEPATAAAAFGDPARRGRL